MLDLESKARLRHIENNEIRALLFFKMFENFLIKGVKIGIYDRLPVLIV